MTITNAINFNNVRFILKNDELATWQSSTGILEKGEIALARVTVNKSDPITGDTVAVPTYLMKVGDGSSIFANLNWLAAPASDVYGWAKKSAPDWEDFKNIIPTTIDSNDDTRYTFEIPSTGDDAGKLVITSTLYTKGVAGTPTKVGAYDFITSEELTTALNTALVDYYTKSEIDGKVEALEDGIQEAKDAAASAIDATELAAALEPYAKTADVVTNDEFTTFEGTNTAAIEAAKKAGDDAAAALETYKGTNDAALEGVRSLAQQGVDDAAAAQAAAEAAQADIDAFLTGAEQGEAALDTLKEIQAFLESDDGTVQTLLDDVAGLKEADTTLQGNIDKKADQTTVDGIEDRVEALEALPHDTYATKSEVEAVDNKFADYTNTTDLTNLLASKQDTIPANTYDAYGAAAAAQEAAATDATNKANAAKEAAIADADAKLALKANDADLAAIAKTGSTDDLIQGTKTIVFNCGGAFNA